MENLLKEVMIMVNILLNTNILNKPNKIEEMLECSICLEPFKQPTVLQCGHSYCKSCIIGFKDKKCPFCRQTFDETKLYHNVPLEEIQKTIFDKIANNNGIDKENYCKLYYSKFFSKI